MRKTHIDRRKSRPNIELNKTNKTNEKEKEKTIIKTQSDIEKELDIRSYSEYRIKDDNSSKDYVNEDVEAKMIRLVILKKKGGNVLENINLVRKKIKKIFYKNKRQKKNCSNKKINYKLPSKNKEMYLENIS